jgi:GNAT superfamily N-acetyltransferase
MANDLSQQQLAELVEFGEAEAYADFFAAAPPDWNMRVRRIGGAVCLFAPDLPVMLFNRAIGLGLREPATEAALNEILAQYRQSGARSFGVQLSPMAQPPDLAQWLTARRLTTRDNWAKVYRVADQPIEVAADLRIEPIDRSRAADVAQVVCTAFGMPAALGAWIENSVGRSGWQYYAACEGDRVVATGALFVRGDAGWLGLGSTYPEYRRRGAQGALMARRIRDAAALGCRWVITETGEDLPERPNPSFHNMLRTGFQLAYQRPNYLARLSE